MGLTALHGPGSGENPHGAFKRGAGVANEGVSVIEGVGVMRGNQYASTDVTATNTKLKTRYF